MKMVEHKLTADEKKRNKHGPMLSFKRSNENLGMFMFYLMLTINLFLILFRYHFNFKIFCTNCRKLCCKNSNKS